MRVLMDDYDYDWDQAWDIVTRTVAYTNHTIMAEALERWPQEMMRSLLPRVYMIIEEIERRFHYEVQHAGKEHMFPAMSILSNNQVNMANLAVVGSHSVNGVAKIHSEILINDVMASFASFYPGRFNNKTNGVTHRRWLVYSNPQLTELLKKYIGDSFIKHPEDLEKLMAYVDDPKLQEEFFEVKLERKKILAAYVKEHLGIDVDVNTIFDCQSKRLHAYKRQLMNIFHIMYLYLRMKQDPNYRITPTTYFFSAKAAPRLRTGQGDHQADRKGRQPHQRRSAGQPVHESRLHPELLRIDRRTADQRGRRFGTDFYRRQGSVRYRKHEVHDERCADARYTRWRQRGNRRLCRL